MCELIDELVIDKIILNVNKGVEGGQVEAPWSKFKWPKGAYVHNARTVQAQRAQRGHSTHMTGRNWGVLLQLAIFLPIQTILHPQPDVCKGGAQEYYNRTWDGTDSVLPRPGEPVVVCTGAVTSSPQACGTPHNHRPATKTQEESLQHG